MAGASLAGASFHAVVVGLIASALAIVLVVIQIDGALREIRHHRTNRATSPRI